ncbi:cell wall anchor protein [Staphylococcus capitis]|uniref:LPXTG-motif cell wall anchor domain protein n=1 Tax=Staphylococcus TaxID=1279 RepID=UPI0003BEEC2D|nr:MULTISPECIES: LPXTG-motif cell wall anchor domain protein [Staphylococcus]ATN02327.1 cell wall anchor protein [Staphylococcus capitis]MBF8131791.1 cell wall anchor protein [Staphylococcus capitis]MDH9631705.1 cell wall anchor protein [Staphylococcus capitis]MDH9979277.1 cell wall anchor protein [Staphylococcus capitis]MDS0195016.1 cell wall anchor protein [Staphylococcus capitis]
MKNNKLRDLKQFPSLPSKKYFSYGTASALTLALYLFAGNGSAQAEEINKTNSTTSPKTIQTESNKTNTTTSNNETHHKSSKNLNDYIDGTPNEDSDEDEDSGTYEVPILYVTVWLDDQGNIIKDAVEDNKTPASERVPVKIPGYQHFRTSISDGITKFIYRKVNTSQTANTATSSSTKKDDTKPSEVNSEKPTTQKDSEQPKQSEPVKPTTQKEPEQPTQSEPVKPTTQKEPEQPTQSEPVKPTTQKEPEQPTQSEPVKPTTQKEPEKPATQKEPEQPTQPEPVKPTTQEEPEKPTQSGPTKPTTQKDPVIQTKQQENNQNNVNDKPKLHVTVWLDDQGNIIKDAVEDDKTPLNQRGVIQIEGYKYIRTETEDGITKYIYKKVKLKQHKQTLEVIKPTKKISKRNEDKDDKTSHNHKTSKKELPETGVKEQEFNPALLMLLAGLGLIGIFRNKIKE